MQDPAPNKEKNRKWKMRGRRPKPRVESRVRRTCRRHCRWQCASSSSSRRRVGLRAKLWKETARGRHMETGE
ncbi:hypothetical protein V6N11_002660 [Hibiscus sabdariffa]|uniref:Uncharacterized protein n=1 Tax=Hibiscus sabdariffa TaxID=183260 RepID=A0ABR2SBI4_9ROSI